MSHAYYADAMNKASRKKREWYKTHLMPALLAAKENRVREIEVSIAMAQKLIDVSIVPTHRTRYSFTFARRIVYVIFLCF